MKGVSKATEQEVLNGGGQEGSLEEEMCMGGLTLKTFEKAIMKTFYKTFYKRTY